MRLEGVKMARGPARRIPSVLGAWETMGGKFLTRGVGTGRMIVCSIALDEIYSGACLYAMPVNSMRDIAWPVLGTEDTHSPGLFF